MLNSIGGTNIFDFEQSHLVKLGIGMSSEDKDLLIFAADMKEFL